MPCYTSFVWEYSATHYQLYLRGRPHDMFYPFPPGCGRPFLIPPSLLFQLHLFNFVFDWLSISKYRIQRRQGFVYVQKHPGKLRCSKCDSHHLLLKGTVTRRFKSIPIGRKSIILVVLIQRVQYQHCLCLKQIYLGFADQNNATCYLWISRQRIL